MARRELGEENIRSVQKSKRSYYITLPISYVRRLGWDKPGKAVVVRSAGGKLIVEELSGNRPDFAFKLTVKSWRKKKK